MRENKKKRKSGSCSRKTTETGNRGMIKADINQFHSRVNISSIRRLCETKLRTGKCEVKRKKRMKTKRSGQTTHCWTLDQREKNYWKKANIRFFTTNNIASPLYWFHFSISQHSIDKMTTIDHRVQGDSPAKKYIYMNENKRMTYYVKMKKKTVNYNYLRTIWILV